MYQLQYNVIGKVTVRIKGGVDFVFVKKTNNCWQTFIDITDVSYCDFPVRVIVEKTSRNSKD